MNTTEMTETQRKCVDGIMDWFDFGKVSKAMTALGWTWSSIGDAVPSEPELREYARRMLVETCNSPTHHKDVGGFVASWENGIPTLCFVLERFEGEAFVEDEDE